jgi:hypothetical protein
MILVSKIYLGQKKELIWSFKISPGSSLLGKYSLRYSMGNMVRLWGRSVIIKDIGGNSVILAKIRGSSVNCRNCKAKIFSLLSRVLTDRDAEILIEASAAYSMRGISVVPMNGYCNMS